MQDSNESQLRDGEDMREQIAQAWDGENVLIAVACLMQSKPKRWPLWHTALDYVLTAVYLALYLGISVSVIWRLIDIL